MPVGYELFLAVLFPEVLYKEEQVFLNQRSDGRLWVGYGLFYDFLLLHYTVVITLATTFTAPVLNTPGDLVRYGSR
jgi:hypothetical protein